MTLTIPTIDIFAGPGGLSEGFHRYAAFRGNHGISFDIRLSIEKDVAAHQTLKLRAFVRQFPDGKIPPSYYDYVRAGSETERADIYEVMKKTPEWKTAEEEAWNATLGEELPDTVHQRICERLGENRNWVLLGGPPCQAYSLIGRVRRLGGGSDVEEKTRSARETSFFNDEKHNLYREYLRIVAEHQPAVFVMENVRGILSSRMGAGSQERIFPKILQDLRKPGAALGDVNGNPRGKNYRIYSFVKKSGVSFSDDIPDDGYLIRSEEYGVPQKRHRVILFGIREDITSDPELLSPDKAPTVRDIIEGLPPLRSARSRRNPKGRKTDPRPETPENWLAAIRSQVTDELLNEIRNLPSQKENDTETMAEIADRIREISHRNTTDLSTGTGFIKCSLPPLKGKLLKKWVEDKRLKGVLQHTSRSHMDSDLARYLYVAVRGEITGTSPKLNDFPESLIPAHRNAEKTEDRKKFGDRFRVQLYDRPATTITSHLRKDGHYFIHPDPSQCRSLSVREAARIQTFPDNYFFEGTRGDQYQQVGNAVPPFLALQLAEIVAGVLRIETQD